MSGIQRQGGRRPPSRVWFGRGDVALALAATIATILTVTVVSVVCGVAYHVLAYGEAGPVTTFLAAGAMLALLYLFPSLLRGEIGLKLYIEKRRPTALIATRWVYALVALGTISFLTKTTADHSRGWVILLLAIGLLAVVLLDQVIHHAVRRALAEGRIASRRLMLVGPESKYLEFASAFGINRPGYVIAAVSEIPSGAFAATTSAGEKARLRNDAIARAVTSARSLAVDDIVLLLDWCETETIEECVQAFSELPVSVQLDTGRYIEQFSSLRIERHGSIAAVSLTDPPLDPVQTAVKRVVDVVVAGIALVLLSPLLALVALAIRLDTPGPVLFRQRRVGYNQCVFQIYKFRSMTSLDDGEVVQQARRVDKRVTRVGYWLRRLNIDELPQLINVLKGEMSIVGPRPHAIAHDREFKQQVQHYPRRLNVLPGITGWAQVNGFRGETDTCEKLQKRIEHDLYYVDNWSLGLDLFIMLRTLSPSTYRNAY